MVQIAKFRSIEFEWDEYNVEEIAKHQVGFEEAEECFFNRHQVFRNKKKPRRSYETFKLIGRTDEGRSLLVIFFIKEKYTVRSPFGPRALVRVITAWEKL